MAKKTYKHSQSTTAHELGREYISLQEANRTSNNKYYTCRITEEEWDAAYGKYLADMEEWRNEVICFLAEIKNISLEKAHELFANVSNDNLYFDNFM